MGSSRYTIGFLVFLFATVFSLSSCGDENPSPKPPCYLRPLFPPHEYREVKLCPGHSVNLPSMCNIKRSESDGKGSCNEEIDLGILNGSIYLYYRKFNHLDSLAKLINISNDKVDGHKIKADKIFDQNFINTKDKVYGTFFTIKGNVATNFQFYLTDSISQFLRGEVMFNFAPNYDSLRPTLDYLREDLDQFVSSFKWKKTN